MKTWEMLKELTENPKKRFRLPSWGDGRYITAMGTGLIVNEIHKPANVNRLKVDWEMLPQEVPWQEAIEAWVNGKCVKSVLNQEEHIYNESQGFVSDQYYSLQDNSDVLATWSFHTLTKEEILDAKWYIL